jgi:hypothetical protein
MLYQQYQVYYAELPVTRAIFRAFIIILSIKMQVYKLASEYIVSD